MNVVVTTRLLDRAVDIASGAASTVMQYYGRPCGATQKGAAGPVTAADLAAHAEIASALERADPGTPIISEEATVPPFERRRGWRRFWLVDPLDGTKEFLAGNGEFTVNIALIADGVPVLGVIAAPALDTVYFAAQGSGAWRRDGGGATLRLWSPAPVPAAPIRVVESRSHPSPALEKFVASLGVVHRTRLGSSLKFCRLAEGAADVYPRFGPTMEWDVAAGDCIYRNAGRNGRQRPSPLAYNQRSMTTAAFVIGDRSASHARSAIA